MSIKLENVFFSYDEKNVKDNLVLKNINTKFLDNSFTALIGRTGSGKSTLIKLLNGLLIENAGKIMVDDYVIDVSLKYKKNGKINNHLMKKLHNKKRKDINILRRKVGVVFQFPEDQIFEETIIKEVEFGPNNFNIDKQLAHQYAISALNNVSMDESYYDRSPLTLSGGEKKRVSIASILAFNPDVLVLDEPTASLDNNGKNDLYKILSDFYKKGKSIIVSTHDMEFVLKFATNVILLDGGEIKKECTPIQLFTDSNCISNYSISVPKCLQFALSLKNRGLDINIDNVKDIQSLVDEIKRIKK